MRNQRTFTSAASTSTLVFRSDRPTLSFSPSAVAATTATLAGTTSYPTNFLAGLTLTVVKGMSAGDVVSDGYIQQREITLNTNAAPSVLTLDGAAWPRTLPVANKCLMEIEPNLPARPRYIGLQIIAGGGDLYVSTTSGGAATTAARYRTVTGSATWEWFADYGGDLNYLEIRTSTGSVLVSMEWY